MFTNDEDKRYFCSLAIVAPELRSEDKEKFLSVWIDTYVFLDYLLIVSAGVRQ